MGLYEISCHAGTCCTNTGLYRLISSFFLNVDYNIIDILSHTFAAIYW